MGEFHEQNVLIAEWRRAGLWLIASLVLTLLVLFRLGTYDFVNYDDEDYVQRNELVQELNGENVRAMFTRQQVQANYAPLTLLSLAIDHELGGGTAPTFHRTNLIFHLLNLMLVFLFVALLTGKLSWAGIISLWMGIHPLHLEPVAWVSSRKDVLFLFFYMGGLVLYLLWLKRKDRRLIGLLAILLVFLLSLLSKAVAVSFPLILFLLDWKVGRRDFRQMLLEKIPFLVLSLTFGLLAIAGQKAGNAMGDLGAVSGLESFFAGTYGLVVYLIQGFFPFKVSVFHPYPWEPGQPMPWYVWLSPLPLLGLGYLLYRFRQKKTLLFGSLFFLLCMAPMLQFLQFGTSVIADRYTYLPYLGLFIAGIFLVEELASKAAGKKLFWGVLGAWTVYFGVFTFMKVPVWENGKTLWTQVIKVYPEDYYAYGTRALWFRKAGNPDEALKDLDRSLTLNPNFAEGLNARGLLYMRKGDDKAALQDLNRAIALQPEFTEALANRGLIHLNQQLFEASEADFRRVVDLDPNFAAAWYNLGLLAGVRNDISSSISLISRAIKLDDSQPQFFSDRGYGYFLGGKYELAIADYDRALALSDKGGMTWFRRAVANEALLNIPAAKADAAQAKALGFPVPADFPGAPIREE